MLWQFAYESTAGAKQAYQQEILPESNVSNADMLPHQQGDLGTQLDLSQFNFDGTNSLCDAWFSQQVINLDYMEGL